MVEYVAKTVQQRLDAPRDDERCEVLVTFTSESGDTERLTDRDDVDVVNEIPELMSVGYAVVVEIPEIALQDVLEMDTVRSLESNKGLKIQPADPSE